MSGRASSQASTHPKKSLNGLINNRYRILNKIGSGGMGSVYKVADTTQQDRLLALKTIRQDKYSDDFVNRFKHEFNSFIFY